VIGFAVYLASLVVLLSAENWILFPGARMHGACEPPDILRARQLTLNSADGNRIDGWFSAPDDWEPQRGAILFCHGNGDTLCNLGSLVFRWRKELGRAILVFDYPGYGKSTGTPSEAGCYAAGEAALEWLVKEGGVPAGEILVLGESLGGATAVELAARHAVRALVLHAAFTAFPDVAQAHLWWYPTRYLVHNRMENVAKIPRVPCPVFIAHGTADRTVPFHQGERLFAAAPEPKKFLRLEGEGHEPGLTPEFFNTVRQFLAATAVP
jgi:uncharacterized protein